MAPIYRSLGEISTGHSVFEKDQVLTHDQLNSVAGYADDQIRLTRVRLLGVGPVCGLRVAVAGNTVTVSKGVGVTTDGDLLSFDRDTVFERFKPYDKSRPAYPPLYVGGDVHGDMLAAYELLPAAQAGESDPQAQPLGQFGGAINRPLTDMTALLLMESYLRDDDLCSGTDCDNLGQEAVNTLKLLLIGKGDAGAFRENVPTPHGAFGALEEIVAERPTLPATLDSPAALAAIYRTTCNNIHTLLVAGLPRIQTACAAFLGDVVIPSSAGSWIGKLNDYRNAFANTANSIQYYYDFLKDVVDTYNEFHDQLFGDATWCVPDLGSFPKHLLLGDLNPGADPNTNRTGFYPSPLVGRSAGELEHATFLARKLDALINHFQINAAGDMPIRVTPTAFEDRPLEERAIPFYYQPGTTDPIFHAWSYRLRRRGMDAYNYSYHAGSYGAKGGAANPLRSQLGRFHFFRIEGHVGKPVTTALAAIETEITSSNLPFAARSVMLGTERVKVVKKPGIRFTDLHRLHYLLRKDAVNRLDEVEQFSVKLKTQVDQAVDAGIIVDVPADNEGVAVREVAAQKSAAISTKSQAARAKLTKSYLAIRADTSWRTDVTDAIAAAGELKSGLGSVARTEFITPADTLIAGTHIDWLPWLDEILQRKEEQDDDRLLFRTFAGDHPQLEHFAGVTRGGTFVLLYDSNGTVVGDVMLPYYCPEAKKEDPVEPPLVQPGLKPPSVIDRGVKIIPSRSTYVESFINRKLQEFEPKIDAKINIQSKTFEVFKDSYLNVFRDSLDVIKTGAGSKAATGAGGVLTDRYLGVLMDENRIKSEKVDVLQQQAEQPDVTPELREFYKGQVLDAQKDLAQSISRTTEYVSQANLDVKTGSEAHSAMIQVSSSIAKVGAPEALEQVTTRLNTVMGGTQNTGLKLIIGNMLGR